MTTAPPLRFMVTVDDPGGLIQDLPMFERVRAFFDREEVPAGFMVVPRGKDGWRLDLQPEWIAALQEAERRGHDCHLHGLDHQGCEFGPYPEMIRAMGGNDPEASLRAATEQYGHLWNRAAYVEKLTTAVDIFEQALGRRPLVFRTGALSQTPELYDAMGDVGMRYASNLVTDPRGWSYIREEYESPGDWDPAVPPVPYHLTERVINLPMISEYAWYLTPEKLPVHLALAVDDLERVKQAGGVYLLICHVQCMGAEDGLSMELLSRLFQVARQEHDVQFQTMTQLVSDIDAGAVPVLPPS